MLKLFFSVTFLAATYWFFLLGFDARYLFYAFYALIFVLYFPKYILSPASVVFAYYGLWFIVGPEFASGYTVEIMGQLEYQLPYLFIGATFLTCIVGVSLGSGVKIKSFTAYKPVSDMIPNRLLVLTFLYSFATMMVVLIVVNSGGFGHWLNNPGDAFLNRGGTGVYVVLSHFSGFVLAIVAGYVSYRRRSLLHILVFLIWLAITSPVHGSKFQIGLFALLALIPWLFFHKTFSLRSVFLGVFLVILFVYGMILRTEGEVDLERVKSYLNYFSTLHNMALLVRDFDLAFMETWFLPFNKFLTPFGLNNSVLYYDMNHFLTDIYYPEAWEIRATEQWPVEADLYLNFYFYLGLPIIYLYFLMVGLVHSIAIASRSLGWVALSVLLTVYVVSHLRGSLYNHTDFYLYPMFVMIFLLLRKYRL